MKQTIYNQLAEIRKPILKALGYSSILTLVALLISILNVSLDTNTITFLITFQQLAGYLTEPAIIAILWYEALFFFFFVLADMVKGQLEKYGIKISVWTLVIPFLAAVIVRSIIVEPYLYQTFYSAFPPFAYIMDALLYFDIKWLLDLYLWVTLAAVAVILLKRFTVPAVAILLVAILPVQAQSSMPAKNGETIIVILTDSLRKDAAKQQGLYIRQFFDKSLVVENMYTVFPASVPTLASIFGGEYPYRYRATGLSLEKQLDLSFVKKLGEKYLLSAHVDSSDDDLINRSNFNVPFDEIRSPKINLESTIYANTLTRQVVLMAMINNTKLRNLLLPRIFNSDSNTNTKNNLDSTLGYIINKRENDKLAFVSIGETHIPYRATYPYYREYLGRSTAKDFKWQFDYEDFSYNGHSKEINMNIRNLYNMSVKRLDDHFKYFVENLESNGLTEGATIVVVADQGENLFDNDLNLYSHNNIDTKHVINVPFAIYRNGIPGTTINEGNYALMDTLRLALNPDKITDYSRPQIYLEADLDVHDETNPLHASRIGVGILDVRDQNAVKIIDNDSLQKYKRRGVIDGEYIVTYHPHKNNPYALYHLPTDPLFQNNLQTQLPEKFLQLQQKLNEFIADTKRY